MRRKKKNEEIWSQVNSFKDVKITSVTQLGQNTVPKLNSRIKGHLKLQRAEKAPRMCQWKHWQTGGDSTGEGESAVAMWPAACRWGGHAWAAVERVHLRRYIWLYMRALYVLHSWKKIVFFHWKGLWVALTICWHMFPKGNISHAELLLVLLVKLTARNDNRFLIWNLAGSSVPL